MLLAIKNDAKLVENEVLSNRQGLRFERIGEMKLILEHHQLHFSVNFTILETLINETDETIEKHKNFDTNDEKFTNKMNMASKRLREFRIIFDDIFNHPDRKVRRQTIPLDPTSLAAFGKSGSDVEDNLNLIHEGVMQTKNFLSDMANELNALINIQNATLFDLTKQMMLDEIEAKMYEVKTNIRGTLTMQQQERLSSMFVSFDKFNAELHKIKETIKNSDTKEMPYRSNNEYYYKLKLSHSVEGKNLNLIVNVPVLEKTTRTLYKIHQIPSKDQNKLLITNSKWKYIANGTDNVALFETIEPCLKGTYPASRFFCVPKSPLISTKATSECLINALINGNIDFNSCHPISSKLKKLTFIKLGNGEYFYYSPKNQRHILTVKCNNTVEHEELYDELGILTLTSGCSLETKNFKILSTRTYKKSVSNSFDIGYKGQSRNQIKSLLEMPAYYNDIHEVSNPIYLKPEQETSVDYRNWIILSILIVIGICVGLFVFIKVKMSQPEKEDEQKIILTVSKKELGY